MDSMGLTVDQAMNYRRLGKTGLMVSEIGFGAEWMERHTPEECRAVLERAEELNILDCWMSESNVRTSLGQALAGRRERWYIADECVGCKAWESRCPFHVNIAQRVVNAARLFQP